MSTRTGLVSVALLVAVCAVASSQPQPLTPPTNLPFPSVSVPVPPPPPPPPPSVDQLLDALERVQAQKASLEKQEQELKATIRKKLDEQNQRLKKLGVAAPEKEKEPDRVGRIIIEGNTKTSDNSILKLLNVRPGQLLSYPALEASRKSLEMVGFRGATVEVIPNELDTAIKDIRVKVDESKSGVPPAVRPAPER